MRKPGLILLGAGGHANACIDVIEKHGRYVISGLVGIAEEVKSERLGYPVIASDSGLPELAKSYRYALVTIGQIRSSGNRIRLYQLAAELGFQLPVIVSPFAYVSPHAAIGAGTIVMHGAIVNSGARVGENCIINTRALVEHDATIEDHCHISTGAIVNGSARVGAGSLVGSGCKIKEGVAIGRHCVVGMGLIVRHDQSDGALVVSKPEP
jgi:sugar O-acyltransferase (sialic acid O-acetyltransferase NeuD family)